MLKWFLLLTLFITSAFAVTVEQEVFANKSEITTEVTETDLLTLNGMRLSVTAELEARKLDSKAFWEKLELKKLTPKEEIETLRPFFSEVSVARFVPSAEVTPKSEAPADTRISGSMKAELDSEKLRVYYDQLISNLEATKYRTFYILADIGISQATMTWEDLGITKPENFTGVVVDSWLKLAQKDFKNFENYTILEKDFSTKPDYMNPKSVTLKWNSTFRKTYTDEQKKTATYELSAQYILVNTKSGTMLTSFDFPLQKREVSVQNKKALSSTLASLVYNLLLSQSAKIQEALESQGSAERTTIELKLLKAGLSEVYALNSLIQEKLKELKATAVMKSFSSGEAIIQLEASASAEQILDKLSLDGGKFPLNEQKILLFSRADKSFAFIPKDSNN